MSSSSEYPLDPAQVPERNSASRWTQHAGEPCPVLPDAKVRVRYRNAAESDVILAKERRWEAWPPEIGESDWDIVAWRDAPTDTK